MLFQDFLVNETFPRLFKGFSGLFKDFSKVFKTFEKNVSLSKPTNVPGFQGFLKGFQGFQVLFPLSDKTCRVFQSKYAKHV